MQVNLLFGFLGSGKTTLVKHLLAARASQVKTAVIVNEFGEVGVDGDILRGSNVDMVELNSGCLCCTLRGSLMLAVEELRSKAHVDRIIVEATGVAQPGELLDTLADSTLKQSFEVGPLITVVDVAKFRKLNAMLGEFYAAQIENADIVILNKIDLVSATEVASVREDVLELNPSAELLYAEQCNVDVDLLLGERTSALIGHTSIAPFRRFGMHQPIEHEHGDASHSHEHDTPVETFALKTPADTAQASVEAFFAALPAAVWRAKGFMSIDGVTCLVQYSSGQLEISSAPRRTTPQIVFIGDDMDRSAIESAFASLGKH